MTIFISYRRSDSQYATGRIYDVLTEYFPENSIFYDVDSLLGGARFKDEIFKTINKCDVVIPVIGPNWLNAKSKDGNRKIDSEDDFVRLEIETALKLHKHIVPVLLADTSMPMSTELPESLGDFSEINASLLRPGRDFQRDLQSILQRINFQENTEADFIGRWRCEWFDDTPEGPTTDVAEIRKVIGHRVEGLGFNPTYGSYKLDGWWSPLSISFLFSGIGEDIDLNGTITLKRDSDKDTMSGNWLQYSAKHNSVIGGKTTWMKMKN